MITEFIEWVKDHPETIAIVFSAIWATFYIKTAKRKEVSIHVQTEIMKTILDLLSQLKIRLPNQKNELYNLKSEREKEVDSEKIKNLDLLILNKEKKLGDEQVRILQRLEEYIYRLQIAGSLRIRNWIHDKLSSSLNNISPWLTDTNIAQLILIIEIELGVLPFHEKIRYSIKNWINKQ